MGDQRAELVVPIRNFSHSSHLPHLLFTLFTVFGGAHSEHVPCSHSYPANPQPQHSGGYAMPYAPMPLDSGHAHPGYGMQPHHGAPPAQFAYGQQFPMHVAMGYPPQQQQQYGAGPGGRGSGQRPGQNVNRQPGPTGGPQWRGPGMPPGQGHGQMQGPGQGQGRGAMQPNRGPQQAQQPRPRNTGGIGSEGAPRTSTESGGPLGGVLGGFIVDMEGAPSEAPSGSGTDPNKLKKTSTLRKGLEMNVKRTIYICDIYQDASEEELATIFNDCGEVVDCRLCGDPSSSLRFAFIEFAEPASVDIAMKKSGTLLGDIPVRKRFQQYTYTLQRSIPFLQQWYDNRESLQFLKILSPIHSPPAVPVLDPLHAVQDRHRARELAVPAAK